MESMSVPSMEQLSAFPLVSNSHHNVYSDGSLFLKRSRSDEGSTEIVLEYVVQKALNRDAVLLPGPPVSLLTPRYGKPLGEYQESDEFGRRAVHTIAQTIDSTRSSLSELSSLAPDANTLRTKVERRIAQRLAQGKNPVELFDLLPDPLDLGSVNLVLTHGDPRPENWLRSSDGSLLLIDWESAILAPWEFAITSFISYMVESGQSHLVKPIMDEAESIKSLDGRLLSWSADLRSTSVLSWYLYDEGFESGQEWMKTMRNMKTMMGLDAK